MTNRFLKLSYVILVIGLLFIQYAPASSADVSPNGLSRSDYFVPPPLVPQLSSDGKTLYNAVPTVVYVADPNPSPQSLRIPPPFRLLSLPPEFATASFSITYVPNGGEDPWGRDCLSFPEEAKTAFEAAASIWANILQSSVPITIRACWADLGGSNILGYSGGGPIRGNFLNAPVTNTWYVGALANALAGSDLDPGSFDMHITYNQNFSWYCGTDGSTPGGQYDLMSVVLHEMAHGLGFAGSMQYSGGTGSWGFGTGYPMIYDRFMKDGSGTDLINYTNPSTALGSALTSNDIWFHGPNAMTANGGARVKMYAPSEWADGSSYSHLDYSTFNDTANELMVYAFSDGESVHDPGPVATGMLKDLGWTISTSSCTYSINPLNSSLFSTSGGTGSFDVTTQPGCTWTATESFDWVDITSGTGGSGSGTVEYTVSSNAGGERSGSITISGQSFTGTYAIIQTGAGPANGLVNPGFESGETAWVQESGTYDIITDDPPGHTGSWYAWFGGYLSANDVLYQQVTIPSWACAPYVQFWYWIETEETSGQNDILSVEIRRNSDNGLLKTLKTFSNLDSTSDWVQSQQFDVTEFIGQTVRLRFAATTNATNDTSFFIDDVSLMVMSAQNNYVKGDGYCAGKSPCHSSIQSAVNEADTCTTINATGDTYIEDVVLNNSTKCLVLQGGYDSTLTTIESNTTVRSLTIAHGKLTVGNVVLH